VLSVEIACRLLRQSGEHLLDVMGRETSIYSQVLHHDRKLLSGLLHRQVLFGLEHETSWRRKQANEGSREEGLLRILTAVSAHQFFRHLLLCLFWRLGIPFTARLLWLCGRREFNISSELILIPCVDIVVLLKPFAGIMLLSTSV